MKFIAKKVIKGKPYYYMQYGRYNSYLGSSVPSNIKARLLDFFIKVGKEEAKKLLKAVKILDRSQHFPNELSGGEQQRVAFCRALANRPSILLADEPTGNLDQTTSHQVFDTLLSIVRETRLSALIATHNPDIAERMDRTIRLSEGRLINA